MTRLVSLTDEENGLKEIYCFRGTEKQVSHRFQHMNALIDTLRPIYPYLPSTKGVEKGPKRIRVMMFPGRSFPCAKDLLFW